jgi:hypothetical protein
MTVIGNNCRIHGPYVTGNIAPSCPSCWGLKAKPDPPPCPDCASLLSRLNVEEMAKVLAGGCFDLMGEKSIAGCRNDARALRDHLMGKEKG